MKQNYSRWRRTLGFPFVLLLALLLWLEEWLWEPLGELMRLLGSLPVIRQLEALLRRAPPWLALACYAVPVLTLLPFKIVGIWLLSKGHFVMGTGVFLGAKVVGTAICARIFALTRDTLMRLAWFAQLWQWFVNLRTAVYNRVKSHPAWILAHQWAAQIREQLRKLRR
ncbi:hypothetical protein [Uliginosibacterium gangwonense]|uniref:hypothetical protein n=1 Tax=Uliginosibacterium gangwonense TaxID=392736 RepID=UPI00037D3D8F|nr:hypothetical protein [Uliginosibacterium gangwonense]